MENVNYTVEDLTSSPSFKRWVEGEASKKEARFWDLWVTGDENNFLIGRQAEAELLGVSFRDTNLPPVGPEWQKLRIKLENSSDTSSSHHSAKGKDSFRWLFRVAAVLLVGLIAGGLAFSIYQSLFLTSQPEMKRRMVTTNYGEKKTIHFTDGSKVIMNANSTISYQPNSSPKREMVVELDGEAYFVVTQRTTSAEGTFSVKTPDGKISVLGTKFAISTREAQTQVVLEEGLVSMSPLRKDKGKKNKKEILRPGELAQFNRNSGAIFIKKINPNVYTSWTTSTLVFDKTPLHEVATRIENTFGVEVIISDPQLSDQGISGSVENSELDIILSALSNTMMIPIKKKDKRVYIGGMPLDKSINLQDSKVF